MMLRDLQDMASRALDVGDTDSTGKRICHEYDSYWRVLFSMT
jgi:hypothetical protein